MTADVQTAPRHRIYHGWWIALAVLVAFAMVEFADATIPDRLFYPANPATTVNALFVAIVVSATFALTLFALQPVAGHLADRHDPRVVITLALLIGGVVLMALSWSDPGWLPYTAAILVGSGLGAIVHITMVTVVAGWFMRNRGKAFALLLTGPAVALFLPGLSIGLWINLLSLSGDASGVFSGGHFLTFQAMAAGIAVIVAAVPLAILLRRKPDGSNAHLEQEGSAEYDPDVEPAPQPLSAILKSRQYRFYVVALSLQASAFGAIRVAAGSALGDSLTSIGARWFGDAVMAAAVVVAVGLFVTGALSDRYDRRKVVAWILGAQLFFGIALVIATDELAVLALAIAIGGGAGALSAANLALQSELWGRRRFGILLGIQISAATLLTAVWALTMGVIWELFARPPFGLDDDAAVYPFVIIGAVIPLAIALALILRMNRHHSHANSAARAA